MPQIALVADEHDEYVLVSVISQLAQPPLHILVREVLRYVVYEESTYRAPVVRRGDRAVPFLTGRVPYLGLYGFTVHLPTNS